MVCGDDADEVDGTGGAFQREVLGSEGEALRVTLPLLIAAA